MRRLSATSQEKPAARKLRHDGSDHNPTRAEVTVLVVLGRRAGAVVAGLAMLGLVLVQWVALRTTRGQLAGPLMRRDLSELAAAAAA